MMDVTRKTRSQMGILPLALFVVCFVGEVLAAGSYYLVSSASDHRAGEGTGVMSVIAMPIPA